MGWKTPSGKHLAPGDHVVWCGWAGTGKDNVQRLQSPDMRYQATVLEVLPSNDEDDGECRVEWHGEVPETARGDAGNPEDALRWLYPFCFELLEDVNAIDRLAELSKENT